MQKQGGASVLASALTLLPPLALLPCSCAMDGWACKTAAAAGDEGAEGPLAGLAFAINDDFDVSPPQRPPARACTPKPRRRRPGCLAACY